MFFFHPETLPPTKNKKNTQKRSSFENVPKWRAEARDIPVVLVGSKLDLCESQPPSSCVAVQEAQVRMVLVPGFIKFKILSRGELTQHV